MSDSNYNRAFIFSLQQLSTGAHSLLHKCVLHAPQNNQSHKQEREISWEKKTLTGQAQMQTFENAYGGDNFTYFIQGAANL